MMPRLIPVGLFIAGSILFLISDVHAQSASISGRILDENNRPMSGATVQIEGTMRGTLTDEYGVYSISGLSVGEYSLVVRFIGYATHRVDVEITQVGTELADVRLDPDPLGLDEIIVSGTFNPATKLESSTAITTMNPIQIESRIPRGTADLLKAVPGLQVNNTYGESGADVTVRGLPQTANSSFRYISLQEDGLPVFEAPGLLFAFPDAYVRYDATIAQVEAVRGGSAAVFSSSTPGGIVNFISKTGGNELAGVVRHEAGLQGMFRQDFNLGGPLVENWKFNVGGYYRYDRGVRYPGFASNRGGQLKGNVTYTFRDGYVRVLSKYVNERDIWFMGIPIQNYKNPEAIPGGPEIGSGTTFSEERRSLTIPDAFNRGGYTRKNLSDGFSVNYFMFGVDFSKELGQGWNLTFRNKAVRTENRMNLMADVADAFPIAAFGQPSLPAQVPRFVRFVNTGATITDPTQVNSLNGNGLMSVHGLAFADQPTSNVMSNLQLTKTVGRHNLNGGLYFSGYKTELQLVQQGIFLEVADRPRMIQVMIPGADGQPMGLTPADGFAGYNSGYWNLENTTRVGAAYVGDHWDVSKRLTLDAGFRIDVNHSKGSNERPVNPGRVVDGVVVGQVVPEGYPAFTPTPEESANGLFGSGRYRTWDYTFTNIGFSVGVNYRLTDRLALYARGSRGTRAPTVQQWTFQSSNGSQITGETNKGKVEEIIQAEAGIKTASTKGSLLLTGFFGRSTNLITTLHRGQPDGSFIFLPITGDTRTVGAEVEAVYVPVRRLEFRLVTTVQDPRFTRFRYEFFIPGANPYSGNQVRDYKGNLLNDAVRLLADLTASYRFGPVDVFANYRYTGSRMANRPNTIEIPAYSEVMAGIGYEVKRVRVALRGTNLLNTQAIALMASRTGEDVIQVNDDGSASSVVTSGAAAGTTTTSRYTTGQGILPRSILLNVTYTF